MLFTGFVLYLLSAATVCTSFRKPMLMINDIRIGRRWRVATELSKCASLSTRIVRFQPKLALDSFQKTRIVLFRNADSIPTSNNIVMGVLIVHIFTCVVVLYIFLRNCPIKIDCYCSFFDFVIEVAL